MSNEAFRSTKKLFAAVVGTIVALACSFSTWADNPANPEFGLDALSTSFRAPDASYGVESIDPFTGALTIVATDLTIPSNGGLDIVVKRIFNGATGQYQRMP